MRRPASAPADVTGRGNKLTAITSFDLMFEILREIREDVGAIRAKQEDHSAEFLINRQHMAALVGDATLTSIRLAEHEARLARIEKRLQLID